jgi:hypothetical protein
MSQWRQLYNAAKSVPTLDMGKPVMAPDVARAPLSGYAPIGWRAHMATAKAHASKLATNVGESLAGHLTDDPVHQQKLASGISAALYSQS